MSDTTDTVDEAPRQHTLEELKEMVHELEGYDDPTTPSDQDDPGYRAAVVMLAALERGAHIVDLIEFTGYHAEWMAWLDSNLRKNQIWVDDKTHCNWFDESETDGVSFWIDVNCAIDLLARSTSDD